MNLVKGTVLRAAHDTRVGGLVHWRAPITTGFDAVVPEGTLIEVLDGTLPRATATACRPLDYEGLEKVLVESRDRTSRKYDGYTIILRNDEVGQAWHIVGQ